MSQPRSPAADAATTDPRSGAPDPAAATPLGPADDPARCDDLVDEESEESFPASDPPGWTLGTH